GPLMRATLHLVSAPDFVSLRPIVQSVLERGFAGAPFDIRGVDAPALIELGRSLLADRSHTRVELGAALARRWPDQDPVSLRRARGLPAGPRGAGVPPRGGWGGGGAARWVTAEAWLGREVHDSSSLAKLFRRYLAAFGPATVRDVQTWSGLTRLASVGEDLRA